MSEWNIVFVLLIMAGSIVMIVKGGDFFVDAASWIAEVLHVPKLIIGATIVSIATTLPELLVSVLATAEGSIGMSIGNAVGSVTANVGLIMALSLLFLPSAINRKDYLFKTVLLLLPCVIMVLFSFKSGSLGLLPSILLFCILIAFFTENIYSAKKSIMLEKSNGEHDGEAKPTGKVITLNVIKFILGLIGIVGGAQLLVTSGTEFAVRLGVSDAIIGYTIVAIGTSLPELVTTITAIVKKQSALSIGNIIGANIIDLTLILPACAFIAGGRLPMDSQTLFYSIPVCFGVCAIAVIPALIRKKFSRWQGVILLGIYITYIVLLCTGVVNF